MEKGSSIYQLKESVATSCRILAKLGLADYIGHVSGRVPGTDRLVIKPRFSPFTRPFADLMASDLLVVDLDGRVVEGDDRPPGELQMHLQILRARPDVGSVIHTHQRMATACGIAGRQLLPIMLAESRVIENGLPIHPHADMVITAEQGLALAQALGPAKACLMRGHGVIVVGDSVEEATLNAIDLESLAEMTYIANSLGEASVISADCLERQRRLELSIPYVSSGWAYYCSLLDTSR